MIPFGIPHKHLAQCGSTNDEAREWAKDPAGPAPSGALVTAEFQARGRGQRGREWQAGVGESALMSFVYRPASDCEISQLGLVTALAVADALEMGTSLTPRIKWPNDILLDGRKAAGILIETHTPSPAGRGEEVGLTRIAILGIGVNVNQERFAGSDTFVYPPTSLRLATGQPQEIKRVTAAIAASLSRWEARWRTEGFVPILEECRRRLALGVVVRRGTEKAELAGLSNEGGAQVRLPDGTFAVWTTVD